MSVLNDISARLPFAKKPPEAEYFFALNIGPERLTAGLWTIEGDKLRVISTSFEDYSSIDEIIPITDKLLDAVIGTFSYEPEKILFGVQDNWLVDDDLKDPYLKILRSIVKELELTPMAYVATSHALIHFLEKQEGSAITAILTGIGKKFVTVANVRGGKLDGIVTVERSNNLGTDIEKGILSGVNADVLPARILTFGDGDLEKQKNELLSFPWMTKLSFLHFPKIEVLPENLEIKAISLAGAVEINSSVQFENGLIVEEKIGAKRASELPKEKPISETEVLPEEKAANQAKNEDLGFVTGDINESVTRSENLAPSESIVMRPEREVEVKREFSSKMEGLLKKISIGGKGKAFFILPILILIALVAAYMFLPNAHVMIYVEPRILEKEAEVVADPGITQVDEAAKKIPGVTVETQLTGSGVTQATGKKEIGDPAKGVVVIYNKNNSSKTLPSDTVLVDSSGLKFALDSAVSIASPSADTGEWGRANGNVTAVSIGPDSNLPTGTKLTVSGFSESQYSAKAEGNFSGGTSKSVTVVSSDDQKKLLAKVLADLRGKAQEELQNKLNSSSEGKKVLQETLSEEVVKKTYNKNINDQAGDFSLNLNVKYKGTAFAEADLRTIVAKLVETTVPDGFMLNMGEAETQADVSKVEKDGRVIFIARFKARLMPKIDSDKIRQQIAGKTPPQAAEIMKSYENILGSDISISPSLPGPLSRLPFISKNITVEVGLK